ncbi:MAG TPA: hypothetical protein VGI31_05375, partial [Streptosporangiaceae bacterium]
MQTPTDTTVPTAAHSAHRQSVRRLRLSLAAAALTALTAGLLPAGSALAASGPSPRHAAAAAAHPAAGPAARAGHDALPGPGPQVSRGVRAVCGPTSPGLARCLSLVRTDLKARTQAGTAPSGYSPADLSSAYR